MRVFNSLVAPSSRPQGAFRGHRARAGRRAGAAGSACARMAAMRFGGRRDAVRISLAGHRYAVGHSRAGPRATGPRASRTGAIFCLPAKEGRPTQRAAETDRGGGREPGGSRRLGRGGRAGRLKPHRASPHRVRGARPAGGIDRQDAPVAAVTGNGTLNFDGGTAITRRGIGNAVARRLTFVAVAGAQRCRLERAPLAQRCGLARSMRACARSGRVGQAKPLPARGRPRCRLRQQKPHVALAVFSKGIVQLCSSRDEEPPSLAHPQSAIAVRRQGAGTANPSENLTGC